MGKRRRSSSQASSELSQHAEDNPFLKFVDDDVVDSTSSNENLNADGSLRLTTMTTTTTKTRNNSSEPDEIFPMVVTFLELTRQTKKGRTEEAEKDTDIARRLLETLDDDDDEDQRKSSQREIISSEDVAGLLLPWAIKRLLRSVSTSSELEWEILSKCTTFLLKLLQDTASPNAGKSHELSNHFSLSTLHKLVPLAGSTALMVAEDGDDVALATTRCRQMAATCYCSWVQHLYRPPFDTVCETLIPLIGEGALGEASRSSSLSADGIHETMATATLELLRDSLKKANPKRAFQSFTRRHTMSALSNIYSSYPNEESSIQSLIRNLLDDGLYHLDHHMDGFRSLQITLAGLEDTGDAMEVEEDKSPTKDATAASPKKSFHCYQESLLTMIEEVFSLSMAPTKADKSELLSSLCSIVRIVPLLLDGFLRQSNAIQHQKSKAKETPGKKKAAAKKILQLQFLFFSHLAAPIVHAVDRLDPSKHQATVEILLVALGQCVNSLLEHDVYLPAYDDADDKNFSYLQILSQILVRYASVQGGSDKSTSRRVLPILATTFQLNHLIFHADLSKTISSCLTLTQSGTSAVPEEAIDLFCTMLATYKRLRQLDYLCASLVEATSYLRDQNDVTGLQALCQLVENAKVVHEFAGAVQSSPIQQTKHIVSNFDEWIQSVVPTASTSENTDAQNASIALVVTVFCLLLKTARIDASSASDLSPLCVDISSSIQVLMGATTSLESVDFLAKCGLQLCGWTIDLKNRCDFWLRNSREEDAQHDFAIPDAVSAVLTEAVEGISQGLESKGGNASEELQLLACHRLQQLHANIHEKQRVAFATDAEEFGFTTDIQETKQIATFALKALQQEKDDKSIFDRQWKILLESVPAWAPYVEDKDMRWFLSSFFERVCTSDTLSKNGGDSSLWLLRDASFLETPNILKHFGPSGISFTAQAIQEIFDGGATKNSLRSHEYSCPPESDGWDRLSPSKLTEVLDQRLEPLSAKRFSLNSEISIQKALRCVNLLNSIPGSIWGCCGDEADVLFEACLRLDYVCRDIARHEGNSQSLAFEMIASFRSLLSRLLKEAGRFVNMLTQSPRILLGVFGSTADMMNVIDAPAPLRRNVLESTKMVVAHLISNALDTDLLSELLPVIGKLYSQNNFSDASQSESFVLLSFGHSILSILSRVEGSRDNKAAQSIIEVICGEESVWTGALSLALGTGEIDETSRRTAVLFVSEVLRSDYVKSARVLALTPDPISLEEMRSEDVDFAMVLDRLMSVEPLLLEKISQEINERGSPGNLQYTSYLIASFAAAKPPKESRQTLFEVLTKPGRALPSIIQDALCQLVVEMEPEELCECLVKLSSADQSSDNLSSRLRLLRLIILNAKSEDQIKVISESSRAFLSLSFSAMLPNSTTTDGIHNAVELIQEMASNKEIISIRERDLCLIFAHVVGALQANEEGPGGTGSNEIFNSCFSIVSFMLQRFSKQLHNCIPSVISCLTVMLEHSLYADLQDLEIIDRGHKFSRLCELLLPHGEFYKKHVLCLVVEFVKALKRNMDPTRRNAISPAIYCLLDILQQYETMQLNSMLDDMGRAMLRTVHESYKKQHVYKGQ